MRISLAAFVALSIASSHLVLAQQPSTEPQMYHVRVTLMSVPENVSIADVMGLDDLEIQTVSGLTALSSHHGNDDVAVEPRIVPPLPRSHDQQISNATQSDLKSLNQVGDAKTEHSTSTDVIVLTRPELIVRSGVDAGIALVSDVKFDYLEADGSAQDRFIKKATAPKELGFTVKINIRETADKDVVSISPLELNLTSMVGRTPIKGLALEAGEPLFAKHVIKSELRVTLGKQQVIPFPITDGRMPLMLIRVTKRE